MKRLNVIVLIAAAMLAGPPAYAHDQRAARALEHESPQLLAQAKAPAAGAANEVHEIHDHMDMMQRKMDKYHASKDQKERAILRGEVYADMRDHMKLMRGPGGMDSGRMTSGDSKRRQQMMEIRMDQTHQMMEWMFTFQSDSPVTAP